MVPTCFYHTRTANPNNKYLVPLYQRILGVLDGSGKRLQVHYDGKLKVISNDIANLGFDGLDSLTPPPEGDLTIERGIARRGLIIRHLVLPNRIAGTEQFLEFVSENLSKTTYINIMRQYRPEHKAAEYPEIARLLKRNEYTEALQWAKKYGLFRLDR